MLCRRLRIGAESGQNIHFGKEDMLNYEVNLRIFHATRCPHRDKTIGNYAKMIMKWVLAVFSLAKRDQIERFPVYWSNPPFTRFRVPFIRSGVAGCPDFLLFAFVAELLFTKGLPLKSMKV